MTNEELRQALLALKAYVDDLVTKRNMAKGIRAGAIAGGHPLHAAFQTDELIDSESAATLDNAADAWLSFLGAGA